MSETNQGMVGKHVSFQNPNKVNDSADGLIADKILSKYMNYYLIRFPDGKVRSIPCHWVYQINKD